jgi:hypothetical protein
VNTPTNATNAATTAMAVVTALHTRSPDDGLEDAAGGAGTAMAHLIL